MLKHVRHVLIATSTAFALLGAGTALPAVADDAPSITVQTTSITKPTYGDCAYLPVQVTVSGLQQSTYGGNVSVAIDGTASGYLSISGNGSFSVPVYICSGTVVAGKRTLTAVVTDSYTKSTTSAQVKVIGQLDASAYATWKRAKKSKITLSGSVYNTADAKGKKISVYFDAKGGKKQYKKIGTAKIKSDGSFKIKTKKVGTGKFYLKVAKTTYTKTFKSKTVSFNPKKRTLG